MSETINGDLTRPVRVDTNQMNWNPSPSGTVWRKRLHLVGSAEAGQVTSVVRYEPDSEFPAHDHPDGEEIFVLDGVFSDEHGDWPAWTYLLNPEGFRHAPFSRDGCLLFVKLRQFKGKQRRHVAINTATMAWETTPEPGVNSKRLYAQDGFADTMWLESWAPGIGPTPRGYPGGVEIYVIDGSFEDEHGEHSTGTWLRLPEGGRHKPRTETGCTLYMKRDGLAQLTAG